MNIVYKKLSAFVFSAIITTSACGMEHENTANVTTQPVTAWYKKSSVQAAAVAVTLAVVGYACAVRMGKVAMPTLVAGLVAVKSVQELAPQPESTNNTLEDSVLDQNQNIVVTDVSETQVTIVLDAQVDGEEKSIGSFNDVVNAIKNAIKGITPEDLQRMNEELVR
jgi:hypothetical protein